jgi:hypothetical protein
MRYYMKVVDDQVPISFAVEIILIISRPCSHLLIVQNLSTNIQSGFSYITSCKAFSNPIELEIVL